MRMRPWTVPALAAAVVAGSAATGHAQAPPFDAAIDVQLFEYAIGPKSFLTVTDGDVAAADQYSVDLLVTFLTNPFTVYNVDGDGDIADERTQVVERVFAGALIGAYGLTDWLQLGLSLPVVFDMRGDGIDPADAMAVPDGLRVTGIGDARAELKARLWRAGSMRMAAALSVHAPTSTGTGDGAFLGDDLPAAQGRVSWQWSSADGRLTTGANAGVLVRKPREVYASTVGSQIVYGGAAAFRVSESLAAIAEVFGRTDLGGFDVAVSPLEVGGGVRVQLNRSMSLLLAGGTGVVRGIGAPDLRASVSVGWAPDTRDSDGDGIRNLRDRCPALAEDRDGFEDDDGCPDEDNDGDLREDRADQCPDDREDLDGHQDQDGCPELDNDGDGLADVDDRCPLEAEDGVGLLAEDGCPASQNDGDADGVMDSVDQCTKEPEDEDGFEDWDGCPDTDDDADGVADAQDQCPRCREDGDGFEDQDGCPELDNDGDGIADARDQCPAEAEILNGVADADGCPDSGGERLAWLEGDRLMLGQDLAFNRRNRLRRRSADVVDQIAQVMRSHQEVTKWLIVAAAPRRRSDDATREQSQRWANVLKAELLRRGIESWRIDAVGAVADESRVAIAVRERAEVAGGAPALECPAELEAVPRAAPGSPGAALAPAGSAPEDATPGDAAPGGAVTEDAEPASSGE